MKKISVSSFAILFVLSFCFSAFGQLSFTANGTQTIDFSTAVTGVNAANYDGSGLAASPAAGQLDSDGFAITGFNTAADLTRGSTTGGVGTGGLYNLNPNVAIWVQPGGSDFTPGDITLTIQNNGATDIQQITVSYDILNLNDQGRSNSFNFSHSTDNVTYTPVVANDFTSPAAADALGIQTIPRGPTVITGLTITPGSSFFIRWTGNDAGGSGSRDEFGLDNIVVTALYAPTAADGTIQGRARTSSGRGIKHAVVMLTGGNLPEAIYATTNQFGNYQFQDVGVGQTYVLQIMSGRYTFQNPSRIVNLDDSISDADFIVEDPAGDTKLNNSKKSDVFTQRGKGKRN